MHNPNNWKNIKYHPKPESFQDCGVVFLEQVKVKTMLYLLGMEGKQKAKYLDSEAD